MLLLREGAKALSANWFIILYSVVGKGIKQSQKIHLFFLIYFIIIIIFFFYTSRVILKLGILMYECDRSLVKLYIIYWK